MTSLERVFLNQARSLDDTLDGVQLQRLLKNRDGKHFDQKLCDELIDHFGESGLINYNDFDCIWTNLQERRSQFERLSRGKSVLRPEAFRWLLENVAGQRMTTPFLKQIMRFYKNEISFDVFVHAVHHIRELSSRFDFSDDENMMDEFLRSVFYFREPTAPTEDDIISFDPAYCTYI